MNSSNKKYKTIVIDPPWNIKPIVLKCRPNLTKIPYKTMTDEEIISFPINDYTDNECVLFMWTTMTYLPLALKICNLWGFKYHATLAWDKTNGRTMFGIKRNVEFVIVCYKGKLLMKETGKSIHACFKEPTMVHSQKPRIFYDMLLNSTYEPRIDIFSRRKHIGFDSYGDQAEEPLTLHSFE